LEAELSKWSQKMSTHVVAKSPVVAVIGDKASRELAASAFEDAWIGFKSDDVQWTEMVSALSEGIRKGYFRMNDEGVLMLTEKGAWRERTRATHPAYKGA
jgi:hypothetical protein